MAPPMAPPMAAPPPPPPPRLDSLPEPPLPDMGPPHIRGFDDDDDDLLLDKDRPPLHPPLDEPPLTAEEEDPDAVLLRRRERLAQAGVQRPPGRAQKKRSWAWVGWLLLLALLGALLGGGYQKRAEIVAFYPPIAMLYEQLGIPVETAEWLGLELHNLKSSTVLDGGQTKIAVSGEVANVGEEERHLPAIRVSMRGADGKELAVYTVPLDQPQLAAKDKLAFDFKLPAPKEDVTDLEVAFAAGAKPGP
ncbi:MAG TPA: DUF3426 domain-containing protein [Ferrovibrio sp.]|uniref:DUF3426 domain-containing protein n=1 Tax=Ferrovibrio sp. TaxID=1917215 RepID=UPI002ED12AE8